jgi:hypothetical protein
MVDLPAKGFDPAGMTAENRSESVAGLGVSLATAVRVVSLRGEGRVQGEDAESDGRGDFE